MADEKIISEQLTEDQLENVAGGTHEQTYDDMDRLYRRYGVQWPQNWDRAVGQLGEMYNRAGIKLDTSERHDNTYYDNYRRKYIGHGEAFDILCDYVRRH